jgi:hypothetical protein
VWERRVDGQRGRCRREEGELGVEEGGGRETGVVKEKGRGSGEGGWEERRWKVKEKGSGR